MSRVPFAAWAIGAEPVASIAAEEDTPNGTGDGREIWAVNAEALEDVNARSRGDGMDWAVPNTSVAEPSGNGRSLGVYADRHGNGGYGLISSSMRQLKLAVLKDDGS